MMNVDNQPHLQARFFTKIQKYTIQDHTFSIPSNSSANALNDLIKSLLKESVTTEDEHKNIDLIDFEFLINNEILQVTLEEYINNNPEIKPDSVLNIEYTLQYPPPQPLNSLELGDWVSSVKGYSEIVLAGSYDHTVQLWSLKGNLITVIPGHNGPVKAVCWIPSGNDDDKTLNFISASHDQSLMIWKWNRKTSSIDNVQICIGHKESVETVDVDPTSSKFISGSWDCMLKLWNLKEEQLLNENEIDSHKKTPLLTLGGHQQNISSCKWMDDKHVCTASWDYTIRIWDMYKAQETCTLTNNNKIFLSIDYSKINNLIIAGLNDRHIRLYDPRSQEGTLVKSTFTSHSGWCSSVKWSNTNEYLFISGSYDCLIKLWDTRSPKAPLYDISGHEDKVFCVDWSLNDYILSGSADSTIKIFNSSDRKS